MSTCWDNYNEVMELWRPISRKAYWTVMNILGDKYLAEDCLQEALLNAVSKYRSLRDETKFESWFLTISVRIAYKIRLKRKRYILQEDIASLSDYISENDNFQVDESMLNVEYNDVVSVMIMSLKSEKLKYLFYLRYLEECSLEEIAQITSIKVGNLKTIYYRMRKDLSEMLNKEIVK